MKFTMFSVGVLLFVMVGFLYLGTTAPVTATPITSPTFFAAETFSVEDGSGNTVSAVLDTSTGVIGVGFLSGGSGTAYSGTIPAAGGTFTLTKSSVYGSSSMPETLRAGVSKSNGTLVISLKGVSYTLEQEDDLLAEYRCRTSSGTGPCDNVITNSDWWRCWRCCLIFNCTIPIE